MESKDRSVREVIKVFCSVHSAGDKPAAMKHSNQSETIDLKSSASAAKVNLVYSILYLIIAYVVYRARVISS